MPKKPKVYLALSGGVDSSVAAVLLLKQGFDVHACFLKIWPQSAENDPTCPYIQDRQDALAVAAKLGLPIQTLDFEKEYKEQVFSYFLHEYQAGRTPNPDILCNEIIKFGVFLEYALAHGADYIATGHHVRREPVVGNEEEQVYHLLAGADEKKDQSYFLARLNQHQLRYTLFPIGNYTKDQVRAMATGAGLDNVASKRSSRGICFIGKVDLASFMSEYVIQKPGPILDEAGEKLGEHKGVAFYTVGQRFGLEIKSKSPNSLPYYVKSKDAKTNTLVVAQGESQALLSEELYGKELHWLDGKLKKFPLKCQARIRYRQPLHECVIESADFDEKDEARIKVKFNEPQRAVAPGQFVVFYQGDELLGSAIIS